VHCRIISTFLPPASVDAVVSDPMSLPISEPINEMHIIEVDPKVHPHEAVLRACYWLSPEAEIDIVTTDEGRIRLTLEPREGQS
jgi:hypothetical protein